MTFTSHGEMVAQGWRMEWDVTEGQGKVTSYSPGERVHVVEEGITPQYLARRVAMFVEMHCTVKQGVLV